MTTAERPDVQPEEQDSSPAPASFVEGLATGTYLSIRGREECYRAQRYRRPLALVVMRLEQPNPATESQLQKWLRSQVRASDVAAYLGPSTYALLLPESDERAALGLVARLDTAVPKLRTSSARYPSDGTIWEQFLADVARGAGVSPSVLEQQRRAS